MKAIIIDDEQKAIEALTKKIKNYDDITLEGTATTGLKGISLLKQVQPELLFLDVELPDMTGLEFLEQMSRMVEYDCKVVIYTAHSMYMLPAFRGKAFDFLLKPVDEEELAKVIKRAYIELQSTKAPRKDNDKLLLYVNASDFRVVNVNDVGLFQFNHDIRSWEVFVAGCRQPVRLKRNITYETLLAMDSRFVQISQRHIINIDYLMEVNDGVCHLYPPFDNIEQVKVGRAYKKDLTNRFSAL